MKKLPLLLLLPLFLCGGASQVDISPYGVSPEHYQRIRILDQRSLSYPNIDSKHFCEISDLAYDMANKRLYMLADDGLYFLFEAEFAEQISKLKPLRSVVLTQKNAKPFVHYRRDSEGMTLDGKGRVLVSFEEQAKIGRFDAKGEMVYRYRLPDRLSSVKNYRNKNKSLESLAYHPRYGILTAAEYPLKRYPRMRQTIYALDGREWHFRAQDDAGSAVVSMEVMDDGNILILERAFAGFLSPIVITLKKVYLDRCDRNAECKSEVLASFDNTKGWMIDNFEGLAKVGRNRYVMVSDDNDNFYQRTLLIYFEVLEE